jgi:hypothetical protein
MSNARPFAIAGAALSGLMLFAASAAAHIDLLDPEPREHGEGGSLKSQPCGQLSNGRTDTVTVYAPGETITLTWNEYINHPSYFRVAIAMDGDDFVQRPPERLLLADDDPMTEEMAIDTGQLLAIIEDTNSANRGEISAQVTLPDEECENCTLQLIQFMYERADSYYYQCADIAIRADAGGDNGMAGAAGATGMAGAAGADDGMAGAAGMAGMPLDPPEDGPSGDADDGGCAVVGRRAQGSVWGLASLFLLGAGLASRRRRLS